MTTSLILTAPSAMTAPLAGTPKLRLVGDKEMFTSDGFSGATTTTLNGRTTDVAFGGTAKTWVSTLSGALGVANGKLVPGSATSGAFFSYLSLSSAAAEMACTVKVDTLPSAVLNLDLFRDTSATVSNKLRFAIQTNGSVIVYHSTTSANTSLSMDFAFAPGDTIGIRMNNITGTVTTLKNGVEIMTKTGQVTYAGSLVGLAGSAGYSALAIDSLKLESTVL